jgi:hypothetical protein
VSRGDSFHDCWANIGTLIQLKDSIESAIAPHAFDATSFVEVQLAATVRSTACNDQRTIAVFQSSDVTSFVNPARRKMPIARDGSGSMSATACPPLSVTCVHPPILLRVSSKFHPLL